MREFKRWRRNYIAAKIVPSTSPKSHAIAVTLAPAAHHERIAVLEKCALDSAREVQRLGAVPVDFQQTPALMLFWTADGAAPQEIPDIHGAAG